MAYEQITTLWQQFITHKLTENPESFPKAVQDFFKQSQVDFLDLEEFDYLEYGQITVRYLDLVHNEEEVEIRLVDSAENRFEPQWGLMGKDEKKYFSTWLQNRFLLQEDETATFLLWTETFLRAVLKKQAE